jgi:hypothetical protein
LVIVSRLIVEICEVSEVYFYFSSCDIEAFFFILRSVGLFSDFSALELVSDIPLCFFVGSFAVFSPIFGTIFLSDSAEDP